MAEEHKFTRDELRQLAKDAIEPSTLPGLTAATFIDGADPSSMMEAIQDKIAAVAAGDLGQVEGMLMGQAIALQTLFTAMTQRSHANMGKYHQATETYMRLALKAQAQSRATLETLAKMKQPREQTIRHIHVGPNGQAVFIENLHGDYGNGKIDAQPHTYGPALLGQDASRNGVPSPCDAERPM